MIQRQCQCLSTSQQQIVIRHLLVTQIRECKNEMQNKCRSKTNDCVVHLIKSLFKKNVNEEIIKMPF